LPNNKFDPNAGITLGARIYQYKNIRVLLLQIIQSIQQLVHLWVPNTILQKVLVLLPDRDTAFHLQEPVFALISEQGNRRPGRQ